MPADADGDAAAAPPAPRSSAPPRADPRRRPRLLRASTGRSSPTPSTTGSIRELARDRGRPPRARDLPTRRPSACRARRASDSTASSTASRCSRSANIQTDEELDEFDARVHRLLGLAADVRVGYVVEPKLDGLAVELVYEGGRARPGLHARRRRERRGRDGEPPHRRRAPARTAASRTALSSAAPRAARCAARCSSSRSTSRR